VVLRIDSSVAPFERTRLPASRKHFHTTETTTLSSVNFNCARFNCAQGAKAVIVGEPRQVQTVTEQAADVVDEDDEEEDDDYDDDDDDEENDDEEALIDETAKMQRTDIGIAAATNIVDFDDDDNDNDDDNNNDDDEGGADNDEHNIVAHATHDFDDEVADTNDADIDDDIDKQAYFVLLFYKCNHHSMRVFVLVLSLFFRRRNTKRSKRRSARADTLDDNTVFPFGFFFLDALRV
jgi:hypothetical protein